MIEKEKNQKKPLNQEEVEELLKFDGPSLDGLEIGDVQFKGRQFDKHINFEGATFTGEVSFFNAVFNNGASFKRAKFIGQKGVDFSEVKFLGGRRANFIEAEFSGTWGANFSGVTFGGRGANFGGAKFTANGCVDFSGAKFSGTERTYFSEAIFSGKRGARFKYAIFSSNKGVDFAGAKFTGEEGANFYSTHFSGESGVDFFSTEFSGNIGVNFSKSTFDVSEKINFSKVKFTGEGNANFEWVRFLGDGDIDFSGAEFSCRKGAHFSEAEFLCEDRISFEDVTFEKDCIIYFDSVKVRNPKNVFFRNAYLGNTSFFQTDVEDFTFKNVKFRKFPHDKLNWFKKNISIHREGLMDEIRNKYVPGSSQKYSDNIYFSQVEITYRQLKRNFEENRDYAKAGDFHYGEMEMKRKRQGKIKQYISLTAFYKYFSGYGQKWTRAFSWFIGFIVLFTFLNLIWLQPIQESKSNTDLRSDNNLEEIFEPVTNFDAFLYTFNTMTLRKDARFEITAPIGSLIVIFQSALGPTILALMLLAIRRQFRR